MLQCKIRQLYLPYPLINGTRVTYENGKIIKIKTYQGKIPVRKDDVIFKLNNKGLVRVPIPQSISADGGL